MKLALLSCLLLAESTGATQLNVYGRPLGACEGAAGKEAGYGEAGHCTFRNSDPGAHQVCVKSLPESFAVKTGQGSWSRSLAAQPWCIGAQAFARWATSEQQPLAIQCNATSIAILNPSLTLPYFHGVGHSYRDVVQTLCAACTAQAADQQAINWLAARCAEMVMPGPAIGSSFPRFR